MTQENAVNMSNEQAIGVLKPMMNMMRDQHGCPISDAYFALEKAIDALKPMKKGEWIYKSAYTGAGFGFYTCSVCGKPYWQDNFNFCPNCGADMRGNTDDDYRR